MSGNFPVHKVTARYQNNQPWIQTVLGQFAIDTMNLQINKGQQKRSQVFVADKTIMDPEKPKVEAYLKYTRNGLAFNNKDHPYPDRVTRFSYK
jgi:hypothetical protein